MRMKKSHRVGLKNFEFPQAKFFSLGAKKKSMVIFCAHVHSDSSFLRMSNVINETLHIRIVDDFCYTVLLHLERVLVINLGNKLFHV